MAGKPQKGLKGQSTSRWRCFSRNETRYLDVAWVAPPYRLSAFSFPDIPLFPQNEFLKVNLRVCLVRR